MDKKYLLISEVLKPPFDEGIKNVAFSVHKHLKLRCRSVSVTKAGVRGNDSEILPVSLNKLFLNYGLSKLIRSHDPDFIIYLPEASITFNSFVRAKILKLMSRHSKVVMLGVKQVDYSSIQRKIIVNFLKPSSLLLLGKFERDFFIENGLRVKTLPPAVDNVRFCQATHEEKEKIRAEFGIPKNKTVVLHVGHIRPTRNVQCLSKIQKIEDVQVVLVGSSSTPTENDLKDRLIKAGVCVIDKYIADIPKVYKMSDAYIFPVVNNIACIDMPLSILEAMACNLPIITRKFGGLENNFEESKGFYYFDNDEQLVELVESIKTINASEINNIEKIKPFTWNKFTNVIIDACEELI